MDARILIISFLAAAVTGVPVPTPEPENNMIITTLSPKNHPPVDGVCKSMLPVHGDNKPKPGHAPYEVELSTLKVAPNGIVEVTIKQTDSATPIRGIYMQARPIGQDIAVGEFQPSDDDSVALNSCDPGHNNAVLYINSEPIDQVTFQWKAPDTPTKVQFYVTIVLSFAEFWNPFQSETVTVAN